MNKQVAHALIDAQLKRLRELPYLELVTLVGKPKITQVVTEGGNPCELEIEAVWDSKKNGDLRVIVAANDDGWRAFKPLTSDFIMRPDGTFVGETVEGH